MGRPRLIQPPTSLPLTLEAVRSWCAVDFEDDDELLLTMLRASVEYFDGWNGILGRALMPQIWEQSFAGFSPKMELLLAPVRAVVGLHYHDQNNTSQTLPAATFRVLEGDSNPHIVPAPGSTWPATPVRDDAVSIRYLAGYPSADDVPEPIKAAIRMHVATLYEMRESETGTSTINTRIYEALIAPYRRVRI